MSTPNDLQALFASIKPRPSPSQDGQSSPFPPPGMRSANQQAQQQQQFFPQHGYHHPSVSSPIYSPTPSGPPPHHGSDILSPNVPTPQGDRRQTSADQSLNLLNLLKFSENNPTSTQQPVSSTMGTAPSVPREAVESQRQKSHLRAISASDLVASFMSKPAAGASDTPTLAPSLAPSSTTVTAGRDTTGTTSSTAADTQEMLLRLLNRNKPPPSQVRESSKSASQNPLSVASPIISPYRQESPTDVGETTEQPATPQGKESSMHVFGSAQNKESIHFEAPQPTPPKGSIFTYINPFEHLAAASPRNRTPVQPQPRSRSGSPAVEAIRSKKETTHVVNTLKTEAASVSEISMHATPPSSSDEKAKHPEQPNQVEPKKETVSEALGELAGQIDREVEKALNRANEEELARAKVVQEVPDEVLSTIADEMQATAAEVKKGINKKEKEGTLEDVIPEPYVETVKEVVKEAADGNLADSWESAEDSAEKDEGRVVRVFNFPLKPFISITVKPDSAKLPSLRDDGIMDVARLKKDFDQLDRCLTTATAEYIAYALAKNGGVRIIRQDDGRDKQIFKFARDRIFSVALCATAPTASNPSKEQAILAIGVSGTVYWAPIFRGDDDLFEIDTVESECLIFAPYPASDENTSGGQLKTRAKRSSRHPEFFGIGRGKNIYIVSPQLAANPAYEVSGSQRIVDTEKFFKERALKISTGKAGKDFVFSEDDTVVASLDKTGRLRFWDIREIHTTIDTDSAPSEVRVPLSTLVTGSPSEKSWPTSVLFIDKLRPYAKSIALRYVLVGLKQNHTLQLWDIGLGKAVQELNFPHDNESDAICSVAYHPSSGILVVGHPTRNSIYFVHLSAPRYNLHPMSQASFIQRTIERDSSLPKTESTACLSGIREISFASKGQLRSLDILPISKSLGAQRNLEEEVGLFEVYVMHSRGVTCLNIKKEDLGWTAENKIINPVNALEDGYIEVTDLQAFPSYVADDPSVNGDSVGTPQKVTSKDSSKETPTLGASRNASPAKSLPKKSTEELSEIASSGVDKAKKKKKETAKTKGPSSKLSSVPPPESLTTPSAKSEPVVKDETSAETGIGAPASVASWNYSRLVPSVSSESVNLGISGDLIKQIEKSVSGEVVRSLGRELEDLHKRFDEERRAWDAASAAKHDQVLRLVSSTLSDNVEKNLARIIGDNIQADVVPAIVNTTSSTVKKQVSEAVIKELNQIFPRELRQVLPDSVSRAVQQPEILRSISDTIGGKVTSHVGEEVTKSVQSIIAPAIKTAVSRQTEQFTKDIERQFQAQAKQFETQRHNDSVKIDQLTSLVRSLSENVSLMAATQTALQNEILQLRHQSEPQLSPRQQNGIVGPQGQQYPGVDVDADRSPEGIELAEIAHLINQGNFEEASVKWLQSSQQADLFVNLFVRLNPAFLSTLSPIVALSIGVAVTTSFSTHVSERLAWLECVFRSVNLDDADIREVAPRIMDILVQRLEGLYMTIAEINVRDPILRRIPALSRRARELRP